MSPAGGSRYGEAAETSPLCASQASPDTPEHRLLVILERTPTEMNSDRQFTQLSAAREILDEIERETGSSLEQRLRFGDESAGESDEHLSLDEARYPERLAGAREEHAKNCAYCSNLLDTLSPTDELLFDFRERAWETSRFGVEDATQRGGSKFTSRPAARAAWSSAGALLVLVGVLSVALIRAQEATDVTPFWIVESNGLAFVKLSSPTRNEQPDGYFMRQPAWLAAAGPNVNAWVLSRLPASERQHSRALRSPAPLAAMEISEQVPYDDPIVLVVASEEGATPPAARLRSEGQSATDDQSPDSPP